MGTFHLHADFREYDGAASTTTFVTIYSAADAQFVDSTSIFETAKTPVVDGILDVDLPANDVVVGGYIVVRQKGVTTRWSVPAQNPDATVDLKDFTEPGGEELSASQYAVIQAQLAAKAAAHDADTAALVADEDSDTSAGLTAAIGAATSGLGRVQGLLRSDPANLVIALVGPSTVDDAAAGIGRQERWEYQTAPGCLVAGVDPDNIKNHGYNGATESTIFSDAHMALLAADSPHVVIISDAIKNDVRAATLSVSAATALVEHAVDQVRTFCPDALIILETGSTYTYTSNPANYVLPTTQNAVQGKIDVTVAAHLNVVGHTSNLIVRDSLTTVYGSVALGTHVFMSADQLHPNTDGLYAEVESTATYLALPEVWAYGRSQDAIAAQPYAPWTVYGRDVLDVDRYVLIGSGQYGHAAMADNYFDSRFPPGRRNNLTTGDIVLLPDGTAWALPDLTGSFDKDNAGVVTRLTFTAGAVPPHNSIDDHGDVRFYRRIASMADTEINDVLADTSYPYKKVGRLLGADDPDLDPDSYIDVVSTSVTAARQNEAASAWTPPDNFDVWIEGYPSNPIVGAYGGAVSNRYRLYGGTPAVDWSAYVGRLVVFTHA